MAWWVFISIFITDVGFLGWGNIVMLRIASPWIHFEFRFKVSDVKPATTILGTIVCNEIVTYIAVNNITFIENP